MILKVSNLLSGSPKTRCSRRKWLSFAWRCRMCWWSTCGWTRLAGTRPAHSHILKTIIRASMLIAPSSRRSSIPIWWDRQGRNAKSTMRFSLEYFTMSDLFDQERSSRRMLRNCWRYCQWGGSRPWATMLLRIGWSTSRSFGKSVRRSEINLRTVEDVLRNYALEWIKRLWIICSGLMQLLISPRPILYWRRLFIR